MSQFVRSAQSHARNRARPFRCVQLGVLEHLPLPPNNRWRGPRCAFCLAPRALRNCAPSAPPGASVRPLNFTVSFHDRHSSHLRLGSARLLCVSPRCATLQSDVQTSFRGRNGSSRGYADSHAAGTLQVAERTDDNARARAKRPLVCLGSARDWYLAIFSTGRLDRSDCSMHRGTLLHCSRCPVHSCFETDQS